LGRAEGEKKAQEQKLRGHSLEKKQQRGEEEEKEGGQRGGRWRIRERGAMLNFEARGY